MFKGNIQVSKLAKACVERFDHLYRGPRFEGLLEELADRLTSCRSPSGNPLDLERLARLNPTNALAAMVLIYNRYNRKTCRLNGRRTPHCGYMGENTPQTPQDELATDTKQLIAKAIEGRDGPSKTAYLVLCYEPYDAIVEGRKTIEYRAITPNYLARLVSSPVNAVRLSRGYGHRGQPPKQTLRSVKRITVADADLKEAALDAIPTDFEPMYLAIHLGKELQI